MSDFRKVDWKGKLFLFKNKDGKPYIKGTIDGKVYYGHYSTAPSKTNPDVQIRSFNIELTNEEPFVPTKKEVPVVSSTPEVGDPF